MNVYSVYEISSGRLTGQQISTSGEFRLDWIPDGCGAVLGEWDHERWVVDHEAGQLIAIPAQPADWTIPKRQAIDATLDAIREAESAQARPMREILEALLAGSPPPAEAVEKMAAIKIRIDTERARYAALMAASSAEDLSALIAG